MKKITVCLVTFALISITNQANAQKTVKKEISKEACVTEENGTKVLTIKTTEKGKTNTEVYKGADADAKLAEMKKEESGTTKTMIVGPDGQKHLNVEQKVIKKTKSNN